MLMLAVLSMLLAAPAPSPVTPSAPPPAGEVIELTRSAQVRELCVALEESDLVRFSGDPAEVASKRKAHAERRAASLQQRFRVAVPSKGFDFGHYRTGQDEVELDGDRPLRALDGALALDLQGIDDVAFRATPDQLKAWTASKKAGALALVVTFRVKDQRCPGSQATAFARGWRVAGVPTAWAIVGEGGAVLASADEDGAPLDAPKAKAGEKAEAEPAGQRSVSVARLTLDEGGDEAKLKVESVQAAFDKCVTSSRRTGQVVVAFSLAQGRMTEPQVVVDGVRDEAVSACLARALAGAQVAGGPASTKGTLTISVQ